MIRPSTRARTYRAIYRLLDRVSPVPFDCGMICGAACCLPEEADDMGIYLLPGEEKIHDRHADWLTWTTQRTAEYEFPASWKGVVHFVRCKEPPHCPRSMRPIQCRSFPLLPHLTEAGELQLIYDDSDLPYCCPLIDDEAELMPDFVRATYTVWKHLIRDPLIYDLVEMDSREREEPEPVMTAGEYGRYCHA